MATLTEDQKLFVVEQLATFRSPSTVVREVRETFSVEMTRQAVEAYDPDKAAGAHLSPTLVKVFRSLRRAYLKRRERVAITHAVYRQEMRTRLLDSDIVRKSPQLALDILAEGAKEEGGLFRQRITPDDVSGYVDDIARRLREAVRRHVKDPQERERVFAYMRAVMAEAGGEGRPAALHDGGGGGDGDGGSE